MKLRSYGPDTEEVKSRAVGMYKSPARPARKSQTPALANRKAAEAAGIVVIRMFTIADCLCTLARTKYIIHLRCK